MKLGFGHRALESQQESVIEQPWMIEAILVADDRVGHATQIEQAVPIGIVPGDAGHFQGKDQTGAAQGHLGSQIGEPLTQNQAGAGVRKILVNNFDSFRGPAQLQSPLAQTVLAVSGLAVDGDLRRR